VVTSQRRSAAALAAAVLACAPRVSVRPEHDGVVLAYDGPAEAAWVTGAMTEWRPVPMVRKGRTWEAKLAVEPGRWEYRLEVLRGGNLRIVLPDRSEHVEDGFGGENAVLRIP
jgi:hypothetical protein